MPPASLWRCSGLPTLLAIVTVLDMAGLVIMVTAPGFADTADKFALTTTAADNLPLYSADIAGVAGGCHPEYL
ncbi:MAG: hypothetical protein ACLTXH_04700 [Enterobacter hormaechei]